MPLKISDKWCAEMRVDQMEERWGEALCFDKTQLSKVAYVKEGKLYTFLDCWACIMYVFFTIFLIAKTLCVHIHPTGGTPTLMNGLTPKRQMGSIPTCREFENLLRKSILK